MRHLTTHCLRLFASIRAMVSNPWTVRMRASRGSRMVLLSVFAALMITGGGAPQIDIQTGDVQVVTEFNGQPGSATGAFCSLLGNLDGILINRNFCSPQVLTLGAGSHTFQLATNLFRREIGPLVNFTVVGGATTQLTLDLTSFMGVVSGVVTVNSAPPPSGTQLRIRQFPQFLQFTLGADGSFSFLSVAGPSTAEVRISNIAIGSFPFEAIAGLTIELGAPIGNTPGGTDVEVIASNPDGSASPVSLSFANVTESGTTTLATTGTGPPGGPDAPPQFKAGSPPTYFNLTTTAVFDGFVTVCIDYSGVSVANESNLKLFHFVDPDGWVDITSSLDTENDIICGETDSLSFFAVFEPENQPPVAQCLDVELVADAVCQAAGSIDADSFDPDEGDSITVTQSPAAPYGLGNTLVTLTVSDGQATAQCIATVSVVDQTPPAISCPAGSYFGVPGRHQRGCQRLSYG